MVGYFGEKVILFFFLLVTPFHQNNQPYLILEPALDGELLGRGVLLLQGTLYEQFRNGKYFGLFKNFDAVFVDRGYFLWFFSLRWI